MYLTGSKIRAFWPLLFALLLEVSKGGVVVLVDGTVGGGTDSEMLLIDEEIFT